MTTPTVRAAREGDYEAVAAFTRDTWADRERGDYIPRVFREWVATDDEGQRTLVAEVDGRVVGLVQVVLLSPDEAWSQGLRVAPDVRGQDVGSRLSRAASRWAHERGATVSRGMVFSWNTMGLGHARANGFEAATEFRWAHPLDRDTEGDVAIDVADDPSAAWQFWTRSDARAHLGGLALSPTESWALCELTRETLREAAAADGLFVARRAGTRGMAFRVRDDEVTVDGEATRRVEYGVAVWDDPAACRALMGAMARDARQRDADETRVVIPETPRHVSDVAAARTPVSDGPDFVMAADLTDDSLFAP